MLLPAWPGPPARRQHHPAAIERRRARGS